MVELDPAWAWIWRAWVRLNDSRPWVGTFGGVFPVRIAWVDVMHWAAHHGYDRDQADFLDAVIRPMEGVFCELMAERTKGSSP